MGLMEIFSYIVWVLISSPNTEVEINSCKYKLILKSIIIL